MMMSMRSGRRACALLAIQVLGCARPSLTDDNEGTACASINLDGGTPALDVDAQLAPLLLREDAGAACQAGVYAGRFECRVGGDQVAVGSLVLRLGAEPNNAHGLTVHPESRLAGADQELGGALAATIRGSVDCDPQTLVARMSGAYVLRCQALPISGVLEGAYVSATRIEGRIEDIHNPDLGLLTLSSDCSWWAELTSCGNNGC